MSDNDNGKTTKTASSGWTDHEILVFLLGAIKHQNFQIDYNTVPIPFGRNSSGIRQKIGRMVVALKPELEAMQAGKPLPAAEDMPKKMATPRKRKGKGEDAGDANGSPTKRGRPKKNVKPEAEDEEGGLESQVNDEATIKDEV